MKIKTKNNGFNFKKGATLMELLVLIGIILIMTGVATVSMVGSKSQKELESAATELMAVFKQAQNNALSGKKSPVVEEKTCGFGIFYNYSGGAIEGVPSDGTAYYLFYNSNESCAEDSNNYVSGESVAQAYYLKNGATLESEPPLYENFYFAAPYGNLFKNGALADSKNEILLKKGEKKYYICLYPSGRIESGLSECGE